MKKPDKTVVLTVDDKPFDFAPSVPAGIRKVADFLDRQPDQKFFTSAYLSEKCGLTARYLKDSGSHPALKAYRFIWGGKMYYGNKASVAQKLAESVQ